MKLTFLLIMVACLQVSARSYGQSKVTLDKKDAPIMDIIQEISRQTGYKYMMTDQWAEKFKPITVKMSNAPVEQVLDKCFEGQPYTYTIVNNTIIVKERDNKKDKAGFEAKEKEPLLTGTIIDDRNEPVVGAVVAVAGTAKMTTTDEEGAFTLKDIEGNAVIKISSLGYYDTTVHLNNQATIYLKLRVKVAQLNDAVVSVSNGYQVIPKERSTGSFSFVNKELYNRRISSDVLSRLEGVVPGMLFNRNTGSGADISIRGRSTLFANAQPLIVIDNFPYDGDINNINPNDIENVTVLKDAAAASIWGVQSGNGVIVITTKKGKRNHAMEIEANVNVTVSDKPDLFYSPNWMSSSDFISVEKNLFNQGYYDANLTAPYMPVVSPVVQILANQRAGTITQAQADAQINALQGNDVRKEFDKYYYQRAVTQQYSINIYGGGKKSDYIFNAGYDRNLASLVGNKANRITFSTLNNFYVVKNLTFTVGFNYAQSGSQNNSTRSDVTSGSGYTNMYPYASFKDQNGNPLAIVKDYNQQWVNDPTSQVGRMNWLYYPLKELGFADNTSRLLDNRLNLGIRYNFLQSFSVEAKYAYEKSVGSSSNYFSDSTYYARNLYNQFYNPTGNIREPVPKGGILQQANSELISHRARLQAGYNKSFSGDHIVTAIIGAELAQIQSNGFNPATLYGYQKSNITYQNVDFLDYFPQYPSGNYSQIPSGISITKNTNRYISYFANAAYTYKGRYTLNASGRIDKSNLFAVATNQKSVPLYSTGLSWNIEREAFFHSDWITQLKPRITYGYNGNINKEVTAVPTIVQAGTAYFFPVPYALLATNGNPDLRWEKIRMINYGIDFSLKRNIVSGSFEFYTRDGKDLFGTSPLAPSTGASSYLGNTANIKGHGFELSLNANIVNRNAFRWTSAVNYTYSVDRVSKYLTKLPTSSYLFAGASNSSIAPFEGKPINSIYSYRAGPLTHDNGDPQGYLNGKLSTDYNTIIGKTTLDSLVFNGSARPLTYGAFLNTISYKSVSLTFNIIYKFNYYFRRTSINYNGLYASWGMNSDFAKRWQKPGDEYSTSVPSMPTVAALNSNREAFYTYSDGLVDKGDHIRFQDISLSYSFNTKNWMRGSIKRLMLYFYVNNVGIIWRANKDHLDPDVFGSGYPLPRTYAVAIKTNF